MKLQSALLTFFIMLSGFGPDLLANTSLPGWEQQSEASVAGIDANQNGIRDDVEILVSTKFRDFPDLLFASNNYLRVIQKTLVVRSREDRLNLQSEVANATSCLYIASTKYSKDPGDVLTFLISNMVNTENRAKAADISESYMGNAVFVRPSTISCEP